MKSRHRRRDGVAVEVESDGSIEIGAIDKCSRLGKPAKDFRARQAERIS